MTKQVERLEPDDEITNKTAAYELAVWRAVPLRYLDRLDPPVYAQQVLMGYARDRSPRQVAEKVVEYLDRFAAFP